MGSMGQVNTTSYLTCLEKDVHYKSKEANKVFDWLYQLLIKTHCSQTLLSES